MKVSLKELQEKCKHTKTKEELIYRIRGFKYGNCIDYFANVTVCKKCKKELCGDPYDN